MVGRVAMAEMVSQRADAWVATLRGDSLYFTSVAIPRICFYVQSAITGFKIFHRLMKYPMHPRHFGWPRIFAGYPRDFDDMAISRQELASRRSIDPSTQGTRLEEQVSNCLNGNRSGTGWGAVKPSPVAKVRYRETVLHPNAGRYSAQLQH